MCPLSTVLLIPYMNFSSGLNLKNGRYKLYLRKKIRLQMIIKHQAMKRIAQKKQMMFQMNQTIQF